MDKRRLTDKTIDKMQNYFGEAIRNNVRNIELIKNDTWAISKHMIRYNSQSLDEKNSMCLKYSWCIYLSNRERYNNQQRLASDFSIVLKPLFINLKKGNFKTVFARTFSKTR